MCSCLSPPSALILIPLAQMPNHKKSSKGSRALTLTLGPVPTPSREARCVPHPTTLYPSYLNDSCFITCPNLQHTKGSGVPTNNPHLGQLSEPAFWRGNLIGSGNLASYRPAHTYHFWAYLSDFHFLYSQGLRVSRRLLESSVAGAVPRLVTKGAV